MKLSLLHRETQLLPQYSLGAPGEGAYLCGSLFTSHEYIQSLEFWSERQKSYNHRLKLIFTIVIHPIFLIQSPLLIRIVKYH